MKKNRPDLSILIPAYREEKRIGKTLDEIATFIKQEETMKTLTIEVLVVSADSSDNTHQIVLSKSKKFRDFKLIKPGAKVGKGRDVGAGMLRARGEAVIFMDADLATPLKHLPKFYKAFLDGVDVVVATRNLRKHHPGFSRRMLSNIGNVLFRILGGVWIEDSQCGFKLFSSEAAKKCFKRMTIVGWGFDMEVLTIAKVNNYKMKTFRVNDWKSVPGGTFESGAFKSSMTSLAELLYIFWNRINGRYLK